jgi:hypothetical protein
MAEQFVRRVGYTEMYEWISIPKNVYARFVQFSKAEPEKIECFHSKDGVLAGVTTVSAEDISDDPEHWSNAYMMNKYGDYLLKKERLAVGIKVYDQHNEFSYISTRPWEHFIKIPDDGYDVNQQYVKRSSRKEWTKVNLLGKVIVEDNGTCTPGQFCTPYIGDDGSLVGTAIPYDENDENQNHQYKFYVIGRVSETTVLIVNKNI